MEKLLRALNYLILELLVSTPIGDTLMTNLVLKYRVLCIEGRELLVDLVLLVMHDFDITLGMDWLASYHASVRCFEKKDRSMRLCSDYRELNRVTIKKNFLCLVLMTYLTSCKEHKSFLRLIFILVNTSGRLGVRTYQRQPFRLDMVIMNFW